MQSTQHISALKNPPQEKKKRPPVITREKVVVHPYEQNIDVLKYANRDFIIPISLPNGVGGNAKIPDEFHLEATLNMIDDINTHLKDYQLSIGNVYIIVTGSITHNDYLLKFQDDIANILTNIAKNHRETLITLNKKEQPEKEIAAFLAKVMQPYADKVEKNYLKKYTDYISKKKFSFHLEFIEWKNIKNTPIYSEKATVIKEKIAYSAKYLGWTTYGERKPTDQPNTSLKSDHLFLENLYTAAVEFVSEKGIIGNNKKKSGKPKDFPMKGSPLEIVITYSEKILDFLDINWFNVYVEGSFLYLTEEGPFFLMVEGELAYKRAAFMQKIFEVILAMNPKASFFQIHSVTKEMKPCTQVKGFSSTYEKIGHQIKFLPQEEASAFNYPPKWCNQDSEIIVDGKNESLDESRIEIKILYSTCFFQPKVCEQTLLNLVTKSNEVLCLLPSSDFTNNLLKTNSLVMAYLSNKSAENIQATPKIRIQ